MKFVKPLVSEKETSNHSEFDTNVTAPSDLMGLEPSATEKEGAMLQTSPHDSNDLNTFSTEKDLELLSHLFFDLCFFTTLIESRTLTFGAAIKSYVCNSLYYPILHQIRIAGCARNKVAVEYTCSMGRHGPAKNSASSITTGAPLQESRGVLRKIFHNDDQGIMWNI